MPQLIISTVGTSLLTNQIDRDYDPSSWLERLNEAANYTVEEMEYYPDVQNILETLKQRVEDKLYNEDTEDDEIREISAELNGIYGIYEYTEKNPQDQHWLITTDTAQGKIAANIVERFLKLKLKGMTVEVYAPEELSTKSTGKFKRGIDQLLEQFQKTLPEFKRYGYEIKFNLVGGFKALQGYLNTIGMFYADEIIYIFEGANSEVIKIPRLPINIDETVIKPYTLEIALMVAGVEFNRSELGGIQEALIFEVDGEVILSNWGNLIWDQKKTELLSGELLTFPKLRYERSFVQDYQRVSDNKERAKLQETLAKVSKLLSQSKNGVQALKGDGGVQLETYKNTNIDHFRVNLSMRVSCKFVDGENLSLRHYGTHDHVERSEQV
ncbi:MAG: putative CRISPR-associated protein [Limnoraphis robusta]|uniref:CRISPR-associated protein n=1 Tax=Limnoraphis robusta CS-951 TaxID=1637645 RepID=A0A0F5YM97_9CYAN|nr:putative CRISPR-associated protein [Limnoraphis robusta]KKD39305.1 CRISPR-associated protein [Limnoraphis robusta CS-951]